MKNYLYLLTVSLFCFVTTSGITQNYRSRGDYNRLGLQAKYVLYDIETDDINISGEGGFLGGLATRGKIYNNWGAIFGIDFFSVNFEVESNTAQNIDYNLIGVQVNVWPSYNIIGQHLSIEAGPSLQISSRLRLNDNNLENAIIQGPINVNAEDLQEISRIVPLVGVGISGGFERVRFTVHYQYGLTNIFNRFNDQNNGSATTNFDGNVSAIAGGFIVYL